MQLKIFLRHFIKYEQNITIKIKEFINDLLTSNTLHTLKEFQKHNYDEASNKTN